MHHFCTYFDSYYLSRALALYESLTRHCGEFQLWTLCMDDASYETLSRLKLKGVRPISRSEFLAHDPELAAAEHTRSKIEFYFTCTPSLPLYVFRNSKAELVTYMDADLFFYADPTPIYEEMGDRSIFIIEHRFGPQHGHLTMHGVFNVGLMAFRRDEQGLACLNRWREQCIEWCYDRLEDGRFADQKYLDEWPERYSSLCVLQHKGAGIAPWNLANYQVTARGEALFVDEDPLLVYHFHGLKQSGRHTYDTGLHLYGARADGAVRAAIYRPYVRALLQATEMLRSGGQANLTAAESIRWIEAPPSATGGSARFLLRLARGRARKVLGAPAALGVRLSRVANGELLLVLGNQVW